MHMVEHLRYPMTTVPNIGWELNLQKLLSIFAYDKQIFINITVISMWDDMQIFL